MERYDRIPYSRRNQISLLLGVIITSNLIRLLIVGANQNFYISDFDAFISFSLEVAVTCVAIGLVLFNYFQNEREREQFELYFNISTFWENRRSFEAWRESKQSIVKRKIETLRKEVSSGSKVKDELDYALYLAAKYGFII